MNWRPGRNDLVVGLSEFETVKGPTHRYQGPDSGLDCPKRVHSFFDVDDGDRGLRLVSRAAG